jgi:hypothetical protein
MDDLGHPDYNTSTYTTIDVDQYDSIQTPEHLNRGKHPALAFGLLPSSLKSGLYGQSSYKH